MNAILYLGLGIVGLFVLFVGWMVMSYGKLWFQAFMSKADIKLLSLVGMGFRQVNPRVIVSAKELDDAQAAHICRDIARRFEEELTYPGEIKVTVIRESRFSELAR